MLKKFIKGLLPNPFDTLLKSAVKEGRKKILVVWNRGLGDIPLGLYALVYKIKQYIPQASVTFLTREDLKEGFSLLSGVEVLSSSLLKRGFPFSLEDLLSSLGRSRNEYDLVIEKPDPTRWLSWQIGKLTPKLEWNALWDPLWESFGLEPDAVYLGAHVQTETNYTYEKNWPLESWKKLFALVYEKYGCKVALFGFNPTVDLTGEGIVDLRGKTNLFSMLSIIKNRCSYLVVPDSGVLSFTYYVDVDFPIKVVSLWADPHQGVLKQKVASPNPSFVHIPLKGKKEQVSTIQVEDVEAALFGEKSYG